VIPTERKDRVPNVVVYVPAESARRIEEAGRELKPYIRDLVRLALEREDAEEPPAELPGQTAIPVTATAEALEPIASRKAPDEPKFKPDPKK
jgi:hypothetical protein